MTKIQISPKWSEVKPEGYYVYLHRRATDGSVFYVGKGSCQRAWDVRRGYNAYWYGTAVKYGIIVEICQDGMSEDEAFLLEMWLIAKMRHIGERISNLSCGGEGSGRYGAKNIFCSNGMSFDSLSDAVKYLVSIGYDKAHDSALSAAASGKYLTAYGFSWSYDCTPRQEASRAERSLNSRITPVETDLGEFFPSASEASRWLRGNGHPNASDSGISSALNGKYKKAYGRKWKRVLT